MWILLMPREIELLERPIHGTGAHADLLRGITAKLNWMTGDLDLTGAEVLQIKVAAKHWQLGYEQQFRALLKAMERHP